MNTIQKNKDYKISGTDSKVADPYLGPINMIPYIIKRLHSEYTIVEEASGKEIKKFNNLEKAEDYMWNTLVYKKN